MSFIVEQMDGHEIEVSFIGVFPTKRVRIGEHEISLKSFSEMAAHFLAGGFFGWEDNKTPKAVNLALSQLFEMYEQVDGKWVRKAEYLISV